MHPADIKASLEKAGVSMSDIAREFKVSHNAVSLTIHGKSRSARIEKSIARHTGKSTAELWPQWHGKKAPAA